MRGEISFSRRPWVQMKSIRTSCWIVNLNPPRGCSTLAAETDLYSCHSRARALPEGVVISVLLCRIAGHASRCSHPTPSPADLPCSIIILLSCFYISRRTWFGGDGSDQMGMVIAAGTAIMSAGITFNDTDLALSGVLAIGGQATLAYFVAGAAKLVSPVWRDGSALMGVTKNTIVRPSISGLYLVTISARLLFIRLLDHDHDGNAFFIYLALCWPLLADGNPLGLCRISFVQRIFYGTECICLGSFLQPIHRLMVAEFIDS